MSLATIFKDFEDAAGKVTGFIVKEMTNVETLLGAKTGNAKLNVVVSTVELALKAVGVNVDSLTSEVTAVTNALVALFNKAGIFTKS